jgi:hypothetical protein
VEGENDMIQSKSCFIIGLPEAGKTSYLAALAYSLRQKDIKTKLCWKKFTENHQYLTTLANTWLEYEKVSRTRIGMQETSHSVELYDNDDNQYIVTFPDLSGEIFQKQYAEREIDKELSKLISSCDGILLFLNPSLIREPILISEIPIDTRPFSEDIPATKEHNPVETDATAVQLVELLQDIDYLTENDRKHAIPLVVVVSAWDVVVETCATPEDCIAERAPLLWQYLKTNDDVFHVSYYGVSAQGGTLEQDAEIDALCENYGERPVERIIVVNNNGETSHDITLPLWEAMK